MLAFVNNYCADLSINKKRYNLRTQIRYAGQIPYFYQFIQFKKAPKSLLFFTLFLAISSSIKIALTIDMT